MPLFTALDEGFVSMPGFWVIDVLLGGLMGLLVIMLVFVVVIGCCCCCCCVSVIKFLVLTLTLTGFECPMMLLFLPSLMKDFEVLSVMT